MWPAMVLLPLQTGKLITPCVIVVMQMLSLGEVVDRICAWMQQNHCCTAGTMSVLRQVRASYMLKQKL